MDREDDRFLPNQVPQAEPAPVKPLTAERRLWFDVLQSAVRDAFSPSERVRRTARDWLFSSSEGDYSIIWVYQNLNIEGLDRLREWVRGTSVEAGRAATRGLFKGRP